MSSSRWACSPAVNEIAMRWRGFWSRRRISCSSTSPPTTSTCAPKMCCLKRSRHSRGTVIFVSHDRYFIDRLATRVLEVEGGAVTTHEGNYEDYLRWKEAQAAGAALHGRRVPSRRATAKPASAATESPSSSKAALSQQRLKHRSSAPPPESHQAEADGRALRIPRRRSSPHRGRDRAH